MEKVLSIISSFNLSMIASFMGLFDPFTILGLLDEQMRLQLTLLQQLMQHALCFRLAHLLLQKH